MLGPKVMGLGAATGLVRAISGRDGQFGYAKPIHCPPPPLSLGWVRASEGWSLTLFYLVKAICAGKGGGGVFVTETGMFVQLVRSAP